ncbi:hypothetical protein B0H14DRAFT_2825826 [Mycena olivaceomarginata]|nr:hypothetical protein B0H14DRAFT_2825826 [Mycena olivaceomarginata]
MVQQRRRRPSAGACLSPLPPRRHTPVEQGLIRPLSFPGYLPICRRTSSLLLYLTKTCRPAGTECPTDDQLKSIYLWQPCMPYAFTFPSIRPCSLACMQHLVRFSTCDLTALLQLRAELELAAYKSPRLNGKRRHGERKFSQYLSSTLLIVQLAPPDYLRRLTRGVSNT